MTEEELERKIERVYRRAAEETSVKLADYTKNMERLAEVKKATLSEEDYNKWLYGKIATGKRWEQMSTSLAKEILNADNDARELIKDYLPEAYADGYNFACYQMAEAMGDAYIDGTFTLYNKEAVDRLIKDDPDLLPQIKEGSKTAEDIREGRIVRWSKEKINGEVTQGILQGESVADIAKRMVKVVGMEKNSAIRNARTATNGAINAGKENSYIDASDMGIDVEQMWVASVDDRTRVEHRLLDGQTVKAGEKFSVLGYDIAYPCDPSAEPEMVYNCRCTIIPYLPKFQSKQDAFSHSHSISDEKYEEWKNSQPYYSSSGNDSDDTVPVSNATEDAYARGSRSFPKGADDDSEGGATNAKEAKELLHDIGFQTVRGSSLIDEDVFVSNVNQIKTLEDKYGAIGRGTNAPDFVIKDLSRTQEDGDQVFAYASPDKTTIGLKELVLNSYFYDDKDFLVESVEEEVTRIINGSTGMMPVSPEFYDIATVTHEYGHVLQFSLVNPYDEDGNFSTQIYTQQTTEMMEELIDIAKEISPDDMDINKELSAYGHVNQMELFAECFMNANCGAPNVWGEAMNIFLERRGL